MSDLISREQTHELLSERMRDTALYNACEDAGTILIDIVQNRLEKWLEELPSIQVPSYVAEIEAEYKKAVSQQWIHKPLAKALYEVWKKHDREDVSRHAR